MKKITLLFFGLISIIGFSQNINVVSGYTLTNINQTNGNFTATNTNAVLGVENIITALDAGPVTINTSDNITINGSIYTDDTANYFNLKLNAGKTVLINNNINLGNGKLTVTGIKSVKNTAKLIAKNISFYSGNLNDSEILHSGKIEGESIHIQSNCSGHVTITGSINATESVIVTGEYVYIKDDANISAFNEFGGGEILIGGDKLGLNPEVQNAKNVYIGPNVTLSSSAEISGQGGKLIVYADNKTINLGNLSASGIAEASGGFIETSGKEYIVVAKAPEIGHAGEWLIDPHNIEIVAGSGNTNINNTNPFQTDGAGDAQLEVDLIVAALTGGASVTVTTTDPTGSSEPNITLTADLDYIASVGTNTLTFNAGNDIIINGQIYDSNLNTDVLNLVLNADSNNDGQGDIMINNTVNLSGGNLIATGRNFDLNASLSADTLDISGITNASNIAFSNITSLNTLVGNGSDTLTGTSNADGFTITGSNSGTVNGITFSAVENLAGGAGNDTFAIGDSGSLSGTINGGDDIDTLDYSAETGAVAVSLANSSATSITNGFSNIEDLVGNGTNTTLTGTASADTFSITVSNTGTVSGVGLPATFSFSDVANLAGGAGNDTFAIGDSGSLSGTINGGDDIDTLDYSAETGAVAVSLANSSATSINGGAASGFSNIEALQGNGSGTTTLTATSSDEKFILGTANATAAEFGISDLTLDAAGGTDTLTGTSNADTFAITGANSGTANSDVSFSNVEDFFGAGGNDSITFITPTYSSSLLFDGEGDADSVIFSQTFSIDGDLTLLAETITMATFDINILNGGDINITTGSIALNHLNAGTGDVMLTSTGAITNGNGGSLNITGNSADFDAVSGIGVVGGNGVSTTASIIDADVSGSGGIHIDDTGGTTLTSVTTANGAIDISTNSGDLAMISVVSVTDADANDITLATITSGNIQVGAVSAGVFGDLTLSSAGSIIDGDNNNATVNIVADIANISALNNTFINGDIENFNTLNILSGNFELNGTITNGGTINLSTNTTLKGTGNIETAQIITGSGNITAGSSIGILNINSNVVSNSNSTYIFELNGTAVGSEYDQILFTGANNSLDLNNASLFLNLGQSFNIGDTFVVLSGFNSLSGQFAQGNTITVDSYDFLINYNSNNITLEVTGSTLSVDDNIEINTFTIFPNPANDKIYLTNPNSIDVRNLVIYDLTGRIVKEINYLNLEHDFEIDISQLSKGTYMLLINTKKEVYSKKVIIN